MGNSFQVLLFRFGRFGNRMVLAHFFMTILDEVADHLGVSLNHRSATGELVTIAPLAVRIRHKSTPIERQY